MKIGDRVRTNNGQTGRIVEFQPAETERTDRGYRRKQGLIVEINGQRRFWYANAVKPLREGEA